MSKHPTLLACDQSSRATGIALFDGVDLMKWDLLEVPSSQTGDFRITEMARHIEAIIKTYRPKMIVFEGIQNQSNVNTVILLARLQGMIMRLADQYQIPYEIYAPVTWRKELGFTQGSTRREALKAQAVDFVRRSYGLQIGEDICEAICIGLAHYKALGMLPNLDKLRRLKRSDDYKEAKNG